MGRAENFTKENNFRDEQKKKAFSSSSYSISMKKKIFTGAEDDEPNGEKLGEREATAKPLHLVNLAARAVLMELILQQTFCILFSHFLKTKPTSK